MPCVDIFFAKNYGSRSKKSEKVRLSLTDNALHRKLRKR